MKTDRAITARLWAIEMLYLAMFQHMRACAAPPEDLLASQKSYTITRPYPYRSFTPTVLIGGVILLILLSVVNFVQNGYTLTVQYVDNPNSTISDGIWFESWPCYGCVRPTCQPANLAVNTQFFTNQTAFTWTITNIWKEKPDSTLSAKKDFQVWVPFLTKDASNALPSVPYMNNQLENCNIREIQMVFDNTLGQPMPYAPVYLQVNAIVTCGISGPFGHTKLNLMTTYASERATTLPAISGFVSTNRTSRSSAYWAEALLSAYLFQAAEKMYLVCDTMRPSVAKGIAVLYAGESRDVSSPDFFNLQYSFTSPKVDPQTQGAYVWYSAFDEGQSTGQPIGYYIRLGNSSVAAPQIWRSVDSLGKSMYSAVLTDLGQTESTLSNIVANPETLQAFSNDFPEMQQRWTEQSSNLLESQSYNEKQASNDPTGPLEITPSVISTNYICQVPKRKPWGDIFISVLLADLVLLQAAWKLYTYAVGRFMLRKQSKAMHCEGCISDKDARAEEINRSSSLMKGFVKGSEVPGSPGSLEKGSHAEDSFTFSARIRRFLSFKS